MTRTSTTRRTLLAATAAALSTSAAGCLGGGDDGDDEPTGPKPDPIDLSGGKTDDMGGMIIGEHNGPNGQVFYVDNSPEGHENPAWFHTLAAGLFPYHFDRVAEDWTARAIYVTDYSAVDYDLTSPGDRTVISSHTAPDTFADAEDVTYVAGSDVYGGMGKALLPFSEDGDADAFVDEHGGRTVAFDDIDREFLQSYR